MTKGEERKGTLMPRRKRILRTPLTPAERRQRSRELLIETVMNLVIEGNSLASISRREHMPSYDTLQRWCETDSAFRNRYEGALRFQQHVMADEVLTIADRFAATQRGRARIKAARFQIAARNWWIAWHEKESKRMMPKTDRSSQEILERLQRGLERVRISEEEQRKRQQVSDDGAN